jgi:hypothetical protein
VTRVPLAGLQLVGECHRCGLCCADGWTRCEHLLGVRPIGTPQATVCAVYAGRHDGLPIRMVGSSGAVARAGLCAKDSPAEAFCILARGVGRGCSLVLALTDPPTVPGGLAP